MKYELRQSIRFRDEKSRRQLMPWVALIGIASVSPLIIEKGLMAVLVSIPVLAGLAIFTYGQIFLIDKYMNGSRAKHLAQLELCLDDPRVNGVQVEILPTNFSQRLAYYISRDCPRTAVDQHGKKYNLSYCYPLEFGSDAKLFLIRVKSFGIAWSKPVVVPESYFRIPAKKYVN